MLLYFTHTASDLNMKEEQRYHIFEQEFLPLADALFNFALRFVKNVADANDLVQETYIKAFQSLESYRVGSNPKAWLFTILRNNFINEYRKREKRPKSVDYTADSMTEEQLYANHTSHLDMRKEIFQNLLDDEVTAAMDSLKAELQIVVSLRDIDGFSYEEIAEIVDAPIGTVRSRLHRGRNELKRQLYEYATKKGYKNKRK